MEKDWRIQTEVFKEFIERKRFEVSEAFTLMRQCILRINLLEQFLLYGNLEDGLEEDQEKGLGYALSDIEDDLRLILGNLEMEHDIEREEFERKKGEKKAEAEN
jgi:hypothetical protein